jgi:hypothetical protein
MLKGKNSISFRKKKQTKEERVGWEGEGVGGRCIVLAKLVKEKTNKRKPTTKLKQKFDQTQTTYLFTYLLTYLFTYLST